MPLLLGLLVKGCVVVCGAEISASVSAMCLYSAGPKLVRGFLLLALEEQDSYGTSCRLPQLLNYAKRSKNCRNSS